MKLAAEQGCAQAQHNYGCCLQSGLGVSVDLAAGARYVKLAAEQGYSHAQLNYGITCYFGRGRSASDWEAVKWFKLAADQENMTAKCCYGICLYMGKGIDVNRQVARMHFKAAAESGDAVGQFCYGLLKFEESGCNLKEQSRGWSYLRQSAQNGCNEAAVILGLQHFANTNNFEEDYFRRAYDQNDLCALYNYGIFLMSANSSYENNVAFDNMVRCFRVVAEQKRNGDEYDYEKFLKKRVGYDCASRWDIVRIECEQGFPESQFVYGAYLFSIGETERAFEYFALASERNHAEAMFACGSLLHKQSGCSQPGPKVRAYFEQAAKAGILEAQYNYGNLLVSTSNSLPDRKHGVELLSMAANEILLRRQCKRVNILYGGRTDTFFYSQLPHMLTKHATENYIWDHLAENLPKIALPWNEMLLTQAIPTMFSFAKQSHAIPPVGRL